MSYAMIPHQSAAPRVISFNALKPLAAANGLCITVVALFPFRTRLKTGIRGVEKKLADCGADPDTTYSPS